MKKFYLTLIFSHLFYCSIAQVLENETGNNIIEKQELNDWYRINSKTNISAEVLLSDYKEVIGLRDDDQLLEGFVYNDKMGMIHKKFNQYYKGVRVLGGQIITHEKNGFVKSTSGNLFKEINLPSIVPAMPESQALSNALRNIGASKYIWEVEYGDQLAQVFGHQSREAFFPKGELVVLSPKVSMGKVEKPQLVYEFTIQSAEPSRVVISYVDAITGQVLLERDGTTDSNAEGSAVTRYSGERTITTDSFEDGFRLRETRGPSNVNVTTMNMNNQTNLSQLTDFTDDDNIWDNANAAQDEEAGDIHWGQEVMLDYLDQVHNWNSFDNQGGDLIAFGHWGTNTFNAQSGGFGPNGAQATRYGDGTNGDGLTMLDVVGHEISHSVFAAAVGGSGTYDNAGLNESFADIFGVTISFWAGLPEENIWILADEVGGIRNMQDPNSFNDPDTWRGNFYDFDMSTSVHNNGNVQDFWYYLLVEGGSGTNDNGDFYDVTPIGLDKAAAIAFRNLTVYITPTSEYPEARMGALMATEDLYGLNSVEYEAVANAWFAVGVGDRVSPNDVGIAAISSPQTSCGFLTNNEQITFTMRYFGGTSSLASGTEIPVVIRVNGEEIADQVFTISQSLTGGETLEMTFDEGIDLSPRGEYEIEVLTNFGADPNTDNNGFTTVIQTAIGLPDDIGVSALIEPAIGQVLTSPAQTVSAEITNFSACETISAGAVIPVSYTLDDGAVVTENLTLSEDLLPNQSLIYQFVQTADFSSGTVEFVTINTGLDSDPIEENNNVSTFVGVVRGFPYTESFEGRSATGWGAQDLNGSSEGLWQLGTPDQDDINAASDGLNAWMTGLSSDYDNLVDGALTSPVFDFTGLAAPTLCFDLFFIIEPNFDGMVVEYSIDGGDWLKVDLTSYNNQVNSGSVNSISPPWYSGTNGGWNNNCAEIRQVANESNVRFRFHFASDEGLTDQGAAIDQITVDAEAAVVDLVAEELIVPASSEVLSDSETLFLRIGNEGNITELDFVVNISVNNQIALSETISRSIPQGGAITLSFQNAFDFSAPGDYDIQAEIIVEGEANPSDNILDGGTITNTSVVTSLDELDNLPLFTTYPNPSSGQFNLLINSSEEQRVTFVVFDYNGKLIYQSKGQLVPTGRDVEHRFDLSSTGGGLYLVGVLSEDGTSARLKRVVVE